MHRTAIALCLAIALAGCAGRVQSLLGTSDAGGVIATSTHGLPSPCPDRSVQGSADLNGVSVTCKYDTKNGTGEETISIEKLDASTLAMKVLETQAAALQTAIAGLQALISAAAPKPVP